MKSTWFLLALTATTLTLPTSASAGTVFLSAMIDPSQEVPPTTGQSSGSGGAAVTIDDVTFQLSITVFFGGLSSNIASGTGIYGPAFPGEIGGLFLPLQLPPDPGTSGTLTGNTTITHAQAVDFEAGQFYVDIFTVNFGAAQSFGTQSFGAAISTAHGEIRGQIELGALVPEPSSFALLGLGLAGLLYRGYSRTRR